MSAPQKSPASGERLPPRAGVDPVERDGMVAKMTDGWPIPLHLINIAATVLAEHGVSPETLLSGFGMTPRDLCDGRLVLPYASFLAIIQRAVHLSPIPDLGIEVGLRVRPTHWGVLGLAVSCCKTLREALEIGQRYHRVSSTLNRLRFLVENGECYWIAEPPCDLGDAIRFSMEEEFLSVFLSAPLLTGRAVSALRVDFQFSAPDYCRRYDEIFRCPVRFGAPRNQIVFDQNTADIPLIQANEITAAIATDLCEVFLAEHQSTNSFVMKIRQALLQRAQSFPDIEEISKEFKMTSRTLRNRLSEYNTSYREILNSVRQQLAFNYLRNTSLHFEEIAWRLGYSDSRSFRRAFYQWAGVSPNSYRKQLY
ncbi:AraC family transcriptional regulator [Telmatospirillum sp.]|uniref:AraC family transcriptional regulator n=1 Tax=Telmatospirillum sp. TaxID=2079197 RepID=UPI002844A06F|nr:AraC family transcriptional regulator [Telmatospirillum sp.]MDR3438746.1 AraC family transcriptional regulator [Telmatospirillum sp.]